MDNEIVKQKISLDDVDLKIMEALRQDGRMPLSKIAEHLGVSPGMIRLRYNRLVGMDYLKVVAITNPLRIGYDAMAMIGVRVDGNKLIEVAEKISSFDEVVYLVIVSGAYDIFVEVFCEDHSRLLDFLSNKLYKVDGVRQSESYMHLKIVKEIYF
jgi:Lrp/AsnC family transcriptional regulator for asnA, asnC and gidA